MPSFVVNTTQKFASPADRTAFLSEAANGIAAALGKDAQYMMVTVNHSEGQYFGGSEEPAAFCQLFSIGAINEANNTAVTKLVAELLHKYLHVPTPRVFINFNDIKVRGRFLSLKARITVFDVGC